MLLFFNYVGNICQHMLLKYSCKKMNNLPFVIRVMNVIPKIINILISIIIFDRMLRCILVLKTLLQSNVGLHIYMPVAIANKTKLLRDKYYCAL